MFEINSPGALWAELWAVTDSADSSRQHGIRGLLAKLGPTQIVLQSLVDVM